jgi:hypothetical protein
MLSDLRFWKSILHKFHHKWNLSAMQIKRTRYLCSPYLQSFVSYFFAAISLVQSHWSAPPQAGHVGTKIDTCHWADLISCSNSTGLR